MPRSFYGLPIGLLLCLTGCTVTSYDQYGYYPRAYGTPVTPYWEVSDGYVDYATPYYVHGSVNYFYVSGRYMFYANGRRHYVSSLPYGGHYNSHHPLCSRGGHVPGYPPRTPYGYHSAPSYVAPPQTPSGRDWRGHRPPGSSYQPPAQPSRSFPPLFGGAAPGAATQGGAPQQHHFQPTQPQAIGHPPQGPSPFHGAAPSRPGSGQPTPAQTGNGVTGAQIAPPTSPQSARPAHSKKTTTEPETTTIIR